MSFLPKFPEFSTVTADMRDELIPFCRNLQSGISEFTFTNLFLDSEKYAYRISRLSEKSIAVTGTDEGRDFNGKRLAPSFFSVMGAMPENDQLKILFSQFGYWKNMDADLYGQYAEQLLLEGFCVVEDRNNFDYVYLRSDLAFLKGKAFHKKKNLVNAFINSYTSEVKFIDAYTLSDAKSVLESWKISRPADEQGDYTQCLNALENLALLGLTGIVVYADGAPVGFSIGETVVGDTMFINFFEKGINSYKGVYQFVNQAQALQLVSSVQFINREQDLGNEGLRQAKMTYRPHTFVKKYLVLPKSMC